MAMAGSRYGMTLFWALVLSCLFTYVMLVAYGRYTTVTGQTAMRAFREKIVFGKPLALYCIVALCIGELTALAGITGIVTDLIREWTSYAFGGEGLSPVASAVIIIIGCFALLWSGSYQVFEKFLTVLVLVMGASFLLTMFLVVPQPADLLAGLVPGIPDDPKAFLIVAGIAGTTCSAMVFIMRSVVVAEKGWGRNDLKQGNIDAAVSSGMMLLLSAAVMACAAGTLYKMGKPVEATVDMVQTLEPLAGRFAISIFVLGIVGAGISTLFPIVLVAPWLISDYRGTPRNIRSPMYRVLGGLALLICLTVPVFGGRSVWIMVASQAFQAILLPVITVPILILINNRAVMGEYKAGFWLNAGLLATLIFGLVTTYSGVLGLVDSLKGLLG
ncbi:MAG: divalent metal cation transporter [Candidatus Glassbacteria bacterium]|nr:divalent metal cation transporter [Candidatus Glassbacteria bacterium]